ncbi:MULTISPECIES: hypothetical protein [Nostocales]|uniref:Uncharacterized protein n=3 Tax=Nostocales TaxID=1161 RepID=A0A0C1R6E8_9CYAN|nr:hypothetical protein [Tolypothrix bouteillei]KAF3887840.1 hypothetical protein DA73_0400021855 [Tolypothrix bouteillei VB521301]
MSVFAAGREFAIAPLQSGSQRNCFLLNLSLSWAFSTSGFSKRIRESANGTANLSAVFSARGNDSNMAVTATGNNHKLVLPSQSEFWRHNLPATVL